MNTAMSRGLWAGAMVAGLALCLPGCNRANKRSARSRDQVNQALARNQRIVLDGDMADWPVNVATVADDDWIYFRVNVENETAPIQASPETLELWLDADNDGRSGRAMASPADAAGMGIDEIVTYSPPDPDHAGQTKPGVQITTGDGATLNHSQIGLASQPTYGTGQYEVRISRHVDAAAAPALSRALAARGRARGMFVLKDRSGKIVGWSDPETFQKPAMSRSMPTADALVPPKPAGAIRILSYNVLKSAPAQNPGTFARIFHVIDADIILCQEWQTDPATASAWFTAVVTGQHPWNARVGPDVVIVSPHAIAPLGPEQITYAGADNPVRFAGAVVSTPRGEVAVGNAHLKCCGTAGSPEDARRIAEAQAINAAMKSAMGQLSTPLRVIGGDLNLVGTPGPLGALASGLDADGSDLAVAQPMVLGDPTMITWSDAKTDFPPGRLDYLLVGDAGAQVVNAFVLDTSRLSQRSLARMGLDHADTSTSDHFPVVIDIKPR
jgi:endonuclease/exonuclease/phosphatase family metal-dependent hydrolase